VGEKQKIDLIIPVYNSKEFMPDLLESIERQTFKDFRVIFVNDGSTDGTGDWLLETLKNYTFRYLYLEQENSGPSKARNYGISKANADWIVFSDSDDVLVPQYLEYLYSAVASSDAEMGYCRKEQIISGGDAKERNGGELVCSVQSPKEAMSWHYTSWIAPVCLILNREWVVKNGLAFDEDCRYCEDLIVITDAIAASTAVCRIENVLYINYVRSTSLLRKDNTEKYKGGLEAFERLESRLEGDQSPAAVVFKGVGKARFVLAILRRRALEVTSFKSFKEFALKFGSYSISQEKNLPKKWQIASKIYRVSKPAFYIIVRLMFKD
jgi:glycosyltransferase involved in cell wall biosynthesis